MRTTLVLLLIAVCWGTLSAREPEDEAGCDRRSVGLTITGRIDGSERITIDREGARWENVYWGFGESRLRLNGIRWDPREGARLANRGGTTFLPVPVDFSTARVLHAVGRDLVAVETADDHLVVRFADTPKGAAVYEVLIRFGSGG